jgi:hypothetical protein
LDIAYRLLSFSTVGIGEFLNAYMIRPVSEDELKEFCRTEGEILRRIA